MHALVSCKSNSLLLLGLTAPMEGSMLTEMELEAAILVVVVKEREDLLVTSDVEDGETDSTVAKEIICYISQFITI